MNIYNFFLGSFVSTLLTAILTNHLGWVATVAPIINSAACNEQMVTINQNQAKMSEISKFHPYNVLWAQLGDLYGSIGSPTRLAKTVVCGAHAVTINKVLSILTYFVRCGEIQRVNSTKTLNTIEIEELIRNKGQRREAYTSNESKIMSPEHENKQNPKLMSTVKGLSRSKSCLKEITATCHAESTNNNSSSSSNAFALEIDAKMHGFSFQQSQMEFNTSENDFGHTTKSASNIQLPTTNSTIKLMVTSPNNDRFEYETASEALDFILKKVESTSVDEVHVQPFPTIVIAPKSKIASSESISRRSLWRIDPVKDGISIDNWKSITNDNGTDNVQIKNFDLKRSHSLKTKASPLSGLRRSKTFREFDTSDWKNGSRMAMGQATQHASNNSAKADVRIEMAALATQVQRSSLTNESHCTAVTVQPQQQTLKPADSVVFVLGDNEVLSGLKTPPPSPNLSSSEKCEPTGDQQSEPKRASQSNGENNNSNTNSAPAASSSSSSSSSSVVAATAAAPAPATSVIETKPTDAVASASNSNNSTSEKKKKKHCTHKKHSGVKFNFEQYPQIVTNYMKNKNLDITSYDFLEKGLKLEQENAFNYGASSATTFLPMFAPEDVHHELDEREEEEQCECCANTFRVLQTPSNATELEFSNDDDTIYPVPSAAQTTTVQPPAAANTTTSTPAMPKQLSTVNEDEGGTTTVKCDLNGDDNSSKTEVTEIVQNDVDTSEQKQTCKEEISNDETNGGENTTVANTNTNIDQKVRGKDCLELITLPIPKTEIIDDTKKCTRIRPGYVPSLFVGITDHFISDMVLQVSEPITICDTRFDIRESSIETIPMRFETFLQGITAPVHSWEPILKQNLMLASHCATFEQTPTENVAIIANIDKWYVSILDFQM